MNYKKFFYLYNFYGKSVIFGSQDDFNHLDSSKRLFVVNAVDFDFKWDTFPLPLRLEYGYMPDYSCLKLTEDVFDAIQIRSDSSHSFSFIESPKLSSFHRFVLSPYLVLNPKRNLFINIGTGIAVNIYNFAKFQFGDVSRALGSYSIANTESAGEQYNSALTRGFIDNLYKEFLMHAFAEIYHKNRIGSFALSLFVGVGLDYKFHQSDSKYLISGFIRDLNNETGIEIQAEYLNFTHYKEVIPTEFSCYIGFGIKATPKNTLGKRHPRIKTF